jgi:hypothetical protein
MSGMSSSIGEVNKWWLAPALFFPFQLKAEIVTQQKASTSGSGNPGALPATRNRPGFNTTAGLSLNKSKSPGRFQAFH